MWVANHTTMIDYVVLSSYRPFAVIMQLHAGWVGFLQTQVLNSLNCLWFNRTQVRVYFSTERGCVACIQGLATVMLCGLAGGAGPVCGGEVEGDVSD